MHWLHGSSMCAATQAWGGSSSQFQLEPLVWHQKNKFPPLLIVLRAGGWECMVISYLKWCRTVLSFCTSLKYEKKGVRRPWHPWNDSSMCNNIAWKCWCGGCQPVCIEPWLAAPLWIFLRPLKFHFPSCAVVANILALLENLTRHCRYLLAVRGDGILLGML